MNLVMQEVLINVIYATQHHLDVPNYKFDEMLHVIDETFNRLKGQAPTVDAYDSPSKRIHRGIQQDFKCLSELKSTIVLASEAGPLYLRREKDVWKNNEEYNGDQSQNLLSKMKALTKKLWK